MNDTNQNPTITPPSPQELRVILDKVGHGLEMTPNNEVSGDSNITAIIQAVTHGGISIKDKNKIIIAIILNDLKKGPRYLGGIKHKRWQNHCSSCGGKGFKVVLETKLEIDPCLGDDSKNSIPCGGSGVKTSSCNRCGGITLGRIMEIRNDIMMGTASEDVKNKFGHFAKIKIDNISTDFIERNCHVPKINSNRSCFCSVPGCH